MITAALFIATNIATNVHVVVDVNVPKPPTPPPPAAAPAAVAMFKNRCIVCHGVEGNGDGPSSFGLPRKPRRFRDAVWQASVTDDDLSAVIFGGGSARKLSVLMPPQSDLKPDAIAALVSVIRAFRAPNGSARVTLTPVTAAGAADAPTKPIVASADADDKGRARVDVGGVAGASYTLVVESAPGTTVCARDVVVGAVDVVVDCTKEKP